MSKNSNTRRLISAGFSIDIFSDEFLNMGDMFVATCPQVSFERFHKCLYSRVKPSTCIMSESNEFVSEGVKRRRVVRHVGPSVHKIEEDLYIVSEFREIVENEIVTLSAVVSFKSIDHACEFIKSIHVESQKKEGASFQFGGNGWERSKLMESDMTMSKTMRNCLKELQEFTEKNEWYVKNKFTYKRVIMLSGEEGTGKSSFVHYVAKTLGRKLYVMNASSILMNDMVMKIALNDMENDSILLIDEFSEIFNEGGDMMNLKMTVPFFLEVLSGDHLPSGTVMMLTTNDRGLMDSRMLRPGRVDSVVKIGGCTEKQLKYVLQKFYPGATNSQKSKFISKFKNIPFANLNETIIRTGDKGIDFLLDQFIEERNTEGKNKGAIYQ
jgi:predicted AAA+ superfamily ATPase